KKEVIYAYGMELLISDVLNNIFILMIALISHTLPAVIVFVAVFMSLRQSAGGYHANNHFSCMVTLVIVMLIFSYGICNMPDGYGCLTLHLQFYSCLLFSMLIPFHIQINLCQKKKELY
ncbi:MAG: accessory gene regulator B family protein, partial [Ruminococcus sp.]|nr:accessory gene regulator B family protein [Ruminococcus sp.]